MDKEDVIKKRFASLRKKAEKKLQNQSTDQDTLSPEQAQSLLHELQVHQIELEMQNEELRRAQLELEISNTKYFDLFEFAPVGYLTLSDKGLILEANLTASKMLGVERISLVKQTINHFIHHDDSDLYYLHNKILLKTGIPQVCELRMTRRDSSHFWARVESTRVLKDKNGPTSFRIMLSNITEHKRAEAALEDSEERFRRMFERNRAIMLLIDPQTGLIVDANRAAIEYYGYSREQMLSLHIQNINQLSPKEVAAERQKALDQERNYFVFPHRLADGRTRWVEVYSSPIESYGKSLLFSVIHDITERKSIEEENRMLAAIVESSDDAIIGKTLDGIIKSWNRGAESIYGYTKDEIIGRSISILAPPEYEDDILKILERIRRGEHIGNYETLRLRKDNKSIYVSLSISPIYDIEGRIIGASTIALDITERKQAALERERLVNELQQALAKVRTLSGMLPICANCKKIRDDKGYWNQIESYISEHSDTVFSHGICPECAQKLYPDFINKKK